MPNTPNSVLVLDQFGQIPVLGGMVGVTDGSSARPGNVGEIISSLVLVGSAVPLITNVVSNVTSITLTPGDWDITASVVTSPAATTLTQSITGALSLASASRPASLAEGFSLIQGLATQGGNIMSVAVSLRPFNVTVDTVVFLVCSVGFTVSTMSAYGSAIARRAR